MPKLNDGKAASLRVLMDEIGDEIETEKTSAMPSTERVMDELAKEILKLERDMTIPGSSVPDSTRIERLTRFIEDREF